MKNKKHTLIVISGPTAIGKTGLSVFLGKSLQTEIISCDSRQFYKEMKIGTAVPEVEELETIPHHFIQFRSIHQDYSVGDYEKEAISKIEELFTKLPRLLLVGGSGLYEKAVTQGFDEFPEIDKSVRLKLNQEFKNLGIEPLQKELKKYDPDYFEKVDKQNPIRVIRALEVIRGTGKIFSSYRKKQINHRNFNILKIGLDLPREELYERINKRVDTMMQQGLLEEVQKLVPYKNLNSLQTVGYKELFYYLDGKIDLEMAIEEIKKNTRRYAKRQMTWYRKDVNINWFHPNEKEKILEFILDQN